MRTIVGLALVGLLAGASGAAAQVSDDAVRIGVMSDQSGVYSYSTGRGTIEAVKLAIADFGGKILGKPIEFVTGDDQDKPDVANAMARKWIDQDKVDVVLAGGSTRTTMAVLNVVTEKDRTLLVSGSGSPDITGKLCHPNVTHWAFDTYSLASTVGRSVAAQGGKSWFFITVDLSIGQALERDTAKFIEAGGGKVLGDVRHPPNSADFASFLLAAQSSRAQIVGLANAGSDLVNTIKQAGEFGMTDGGQRLAALFMYVNDVQSLGLAVAQNTLGATSFYHNLNDATRAWTARYRQAFPGNNLPNMVQAGAYAAVTHYLKAVQAAGTDAAAPVGKKMREMPVNDFFNKDVVIRADGRVLPDMMLWRAKTPQESTGPIDLLAILETVPGARAFRPEAESGCPLLKKQ
ncbi:MULTISPECIES: ABC transporter substrate-binding protein [Bradyrhizobium]|uniref:Amino acid/amide ABC transporter substrate-binding protein, HAAT family n=2 Tax=Bradyrhizobium TaxID=374 RepID=A0ABY0PEK8_9BRAD|nr:MULTISPECIES: ABC transporter substrate-binding protein [Bradyrhizobium]SDI21989.1 amino acid/amide ABC transporter substrate-binding protein, HAAT family [Bradyrhizobium ottawaense]SED72903.1 amino acid/amide ABC transporter substrate-binding protein, HAAT family [Bradyrhizobium lablabi]SHL68813.1 amino acid/amide ABC transporter substrate-binding protein, HAAT family [Bradyrhizobium lablabi]